MQLKELNNNQSKIKEIIFIAGIFLLILGCTISITYAFMSVSDKQEVANTLNTNGCLNVAIENEGSAISLSSVSPITDLEGLETTGYTFTIKNTCSTKTNYQINLESLNESANSLKADYIKVALSSDTMDNLISILSSNTKIIPTIANSYEGYNLYSGELEGNTSKTFKLREWMDYDTTAEQGASKTYTSKINVIANPDIEVVKMPEIKTTINNFKLTGEIAGSATNINYCISNNSVCEANTSTTITNNKIELTLNRDNKQIICTKIDNNKTTCTDVIGIFKGITVDDIIAANNPKTTTPDFSKVATTDEGVYAVEDGMYGGTSYYWRGAVTNNYVKFANKCWRIIRINGDGSIRLIYDGTTCHANGIVSTERVIEGNTNYNYLNGDNSKVGWTYTNGEQKPTLNIDSVTGLTVGGTDSIAKVTTESWFNNNSNFTDKQREIVAIGKYCNDRSVEEGTYYTSYSSTDKPFYYGGYVRYSTTKVPTLKCPEGDIYHLKVGALTVDEGMYAGAYTESGSSYTTNKSYFLYKGFKYWTMTPSWGYDRCSVFIMRTEGDLDSGIIYQSNSGVYNIIYLAPVINLRADVTFTLGGNGTQNNPYVVN